MRRATGKPWVAENRPDANGEAAAINAAAVNAALRPRPGYACGQCPQG